MLVLLLIYSILSFLIVFLWFSLLRQQSTLFLEIKKPCYPIFDERNLLFQTFASPMDAKISKFTGSTISKNRSNISFHAVILDETRNVIFWDYGLESLTGINSASIIAKPIDYLLEKIGQAEQQSPFLNSFCQILNSLKSFSPDDSEPNYYCLELPLREFEEKTIVNGFLIQGDDKNFDEKLFIGVVEGLDYSQAQNQFNNFPNEFFQAALEAANDAIFLLSTKDLIIRGLNLNAIDLLGYSSKNLVGKDGSEILGLDLLTENKQACSGCHGLLTNTNWILSNGSKIPVAMSCKEFSIDQVDYYIVIGRDIREQIKTQEEERKQRQLAEALRDVAEALNSTLDLDTLLDRVLKNLELVIPFTTANIMLVEDGVVVITNGRGYSSESLRTWQQSWYTPIDKLPILRLMNETRKPIVFPTTRDNEQWIRFPETDWIQSYAGAPIIRHEKLFGYININNKTEWAYSQRDVEKIRIFADQVAIALENARLFTETSLRADRLKLLNEIATSINEPGDLTKVLQAAADGLATVLSVEQTGIALLDNTKEYLVVAAEHSIPGIPSAVGEKIPIRNNASMAHLLENLAPLPIFDAQHDPLLTSIHEIMSERRVQSILLVPLIDHNQLIGTLGCDVIRKQRKFSQEEVNLAVTLAGLLSARINQANLLDIERRHNAELEIVRGILHLLNASTAISGVLDNIYHPLHSLTGATNVSLAIISDDLQHYQMLVNSDQKISAQNRDSYRLEESADSEDILVGKTHQTNDILVEQSFPIFAQLFAAGYRSRISFPLATGSRVFGSFSLAWHEKNGFRNVNLALVEQIADALALAIERLRLLEDTKRRDIILETLAFSAEAILRAKNLDDFLPELFYRLGGGIGASRVYLFENIADSDQPENVFLKYSWEADPSLPQSIFKELQVFNYKKFGLEHWESILSSGKSVFGLVSSFPGPEKKLLVTDGIHSIVLIPIFVRGSWWGFIGLGDCKAERNWTLTEVDALKSLADTIGGGLARMDSERAEKAQLTLTEALRDTTAVMTATVHIKDVFEHILKNIARVFAFDAANILLLKSGFLYVGCTYRYAEIGEIDPSSAFPRPITDFPNLAKLFSSHKAVIVPDTQNDPEWNQLSVVSWIRSNICAPIKYKDQIIGFLNLDSRQANFFRENDADRLLAFAHQAAIAIENTRLFEETHIRAVQMSLLNRMTQAAIESKSVGEILHTLSVQLASLMDANSAYILLRDEFGDDVRISASAGKHTLFGNGSVLLPNLKKLATKALHRGHPRIIENILDDIQVDTNNLGPMKKISMMILPLISGSEKLGVAALVFNENRTLSIDDLALGEQAAGQIALALAKANLLEIERLRASTLERVNTILTALSHVSVRLETVRDPDDVLMTMGEELKKLGILCMVWMSNDDNTSLKFRYSSFDRRILRSLEIFMGNNLNLYKLQKHEFTHFDDVLLKRKAVFIEDFRYLLGKVFPELHSRAIKILSKQMGYEERISGFFLPLMAEENVIGTIWMLAKEFTQHDQAAATIFASQVAMALENSRLYSNIQQLAITDELTGLYNRRGLMELGQREFDRARRFNRTLYALMFDLDDFRMINNTYGHSVGDEVLRELAVRCRLVLRSTDVLGRYGGEEFTVLLPETDRNAAMEIAERLRYLVVSSPFETTRAAVKISISIGIAALEKDCPSLNDLLDRADQGLYKAKRAGKNCVHNVD
jgi:diguanylate cyclase (GGDEF)-like protein/PAS domain S-box-containing protein